MEMKHYTNTSQITEPKLDDIQYYLYVIENDTLAIKIGISHDVSQRVLSLSNSNCGGAKILRVAVSPPTYLRTMEGIVHQKFSDYRVPNTEWFRGVTYETVVEYIESLFNQKNYNDLNETRKLLNGYRHR